MLMDLVALFWSFLKIGFTSFGGLSMVPLINSEMISHGWMTATEVSDILAIAEMTPGPVGLNCATFAGIQVAGIPGALAAGLGVLTPTLTMTLVAAIFFERWKDSRRMQQALTGIRPAAMGLLGAVVVSLCATNYLQSGQPEPVLIAIGAVGLFALLKLRWGVPAVIGISALLGLIFVR
jgi:chromate transporter